MRTNTQRIEKLRRQVGRSRNENRQTLIGDRISESGRLDRSILNREIDAILQEATVDPALASRMVGQMDSLLSHARAGDVPAAARYVTTLLSVDLDELRKAALLSLMVRLTGKRRFDPIAAYILQNQKTHATGQG